jgi:CBS domain-containing protein
MTRILLVRDLMTDPVVTLTLGDTLAVAEETMLRAKVRHLPVTAGDERLVGLITHGMILSAWVGHGDPLHERHADVARDVPVEMIMRRELITIPPGAPAAAAARIMEDKRIGCVPVVEDDGRLVGIMTESDFVRFARMYLERGMATD